MKIWDEIEYYDWNIHQVKKLDFDKKIHSISKPINSDIYEKKSVK